MAQLRAWLPSCSLKFYKMSMLSTSYFPKQLRQTTRIPSSARRLHQIRLSVLFNYFALLFGKQKPLFSFLSTTDCICSPNPPPQPTHGSLWTSFTYIEITLAKRFEGKVPNAARFLNKCYCLKKVSLNYIAPQTSSKA